MEKRDDVSYESYIKYLYSKGLRKPILKALRQPTVLFFLLGPFLHFLTYPRDEHALDLLTKFWVDILNFLVAAAYLVFGGPVVLTFAYYVIMLAVVGLALLSIYKAAPIKHRRRAAVAYIPMVFTSAISHFARIDADISSAGVLLYVIVVTAIIYPWISLRQFLWLKHKAKWFKGFREDIEQIGAAD